MTCNAPSFSLEISARRSSYCAGILFLLYDVVLVWYHGSWSHTARTLYQQPAKNTKKSPRSRPPGAIIGSVDGQGIVQTSAQALDTLRGYIRRKRDDFKQLVECTW